MENIKTYEGFLDIFRRDINIAAGWIDKILKGKKDLKSGKEYLKNETRFWTWRELVGVLELDFRLVLTEFDTHVSGFQNQFTLGVECQSVTKDDIKSDFDSGYFSISKIEDFKEMLLMLLRSCKVLAVGRFENNRFVEDFPLDDIWDYLIDLKDLVDEIEIVLEKTGINKEYYNTFQYLFKLKGFIIETPSYIVTVKGLNRGNIQDVNKELEEIESNIKNLGLEITTIDDSLTKFYKFRLERIISTL